MDLLNTIRAKAEKPRSALTQRPLGEFMVLGTLLLGLQHGFSGLNATDSGNEQNLPLQVGLPILHSEQTLTSLVDTINNPHAWVHHPLNHARVNQTASDSKQIAKTAHNKRVFTRQAETSNTQFYFTSALKQPLFKALGDDPFQAGNSATSKLAIWHVNKKFAFAREYLAAPPAKPIKKPGEKFVIMLDPGHGGSDPGSIGHNGLEEKALTLDIAKRAERILEKQSNVQVLLTRDSDKGMSRKNRVQRVKNSGADMVVSLHLNHLPQTDVNLVETFYAAPRNIRESMEMQRAKHAGLVKTTATRNRDLSFTEGSRRLASLMQKSVYEEVIQTNPDTDNAGVKQDTLYILTRSFTPGVLIELSCLSNIQEAERLSDPAYRQRLAESLARGIGEYLTTPAARRQFDPEV